jgi:hypothetical protein
VGFAQESDPMPAISKTVKKDGKLTTKSLTAQTKQKETVGIQKKELLGLN